MKCMAKKCNNRFRKGNKVSFFNFPKDVTLLNAWLSFCGLKRSTKLRPTWRVCSKHFKPEEILGKLQCNLGIPRQLLLKADAIPTILETNEESERGKRLAKRNRGKQVESLLKEIEVVPQQQEKNDRSNQDAFVQKIHSDAEVNCSEVSVGSYQNAFKQEMHSDAEVACCQVSTGSNQNVFKQEMHSDVEVDCSQVSAGPNQDDFKPEAQDDCSHVFIKSYQYAFTQEMHTNSIVSAGTNDASVAFSNANTCDDAALNQIKMLKSQIKLLQSENGKLAKKIHNREKEMSCIILKKDSEIQKLKLMLNKTENECKNIEKRLKEIFSEGQIDKIQKGDKRQNWTKEDITRSMAFYSTSPKGYILLRKNKFPLPSIRTLQRWSQQYRNSEQL